MMSALLISSSFHWLCRTPRSGSPVPSFTFLTTRFHTCTALSGVASPPPTPHPHQGRTSLHRTLRLRTLDLLETVSLSASLQDSFVYSKLFPKSRVWVDNRSSLLGVGKSTRQRPSKVFHSKGTDCRGRPTNTHFAVHQNLATHLLSTVDEIVRLVPILEQICFLYIPLSDVEILEHRRKEVVNFPKKQNFIFQSSKVI